MWGVSQVRGCPSCVFTWPTRNGQAKSNGMPRIIRMGWAASIGSRLVLPAISSCGSAMRPTYSSPHQRKRCVTYVMPTCLIWLSSMLANLRSDDPFELNWANWLSCICAYRWRHPDDDWLLGGLAGCQPQEADARPEQERTGDQNRRSDGEGP